MVKNRKEKVTLVGLAASIERVAALVVEQSNFVRDELRGEIVELRTEMGGLRDEMGAKFLAVHNRLDDLAWNRASRDDLAATNARVTRIEGHLGLA